MLFKTIFLINLFYSKVSEFSFCVNQSMPMYPPANINIIIKTVLLEFEKNSGQVEPINKPKENKASS